ARNRHGGLHAGHVAALAPAAHARVERGDPRSAARRAALRFVLLRGVYEQRASALGFEEVELRGVVPQLHLLALLDLARRFEDGPRPALPPPRRLHPSGGPRQ